MRESPEPLYEPSQGGLHQLVRVAIDNVEELIASLFLAAIGLSVLAQVVLRTVFSAPMNWPEELSQFLLVWASTLGAIGAIKRGSLISLSVFLDLASPQARQVMSWLAVAGTTILLAMLFWHGLQLTQRASYSATALPITWAWAYAAAPVFSVLAFLRMIQATALHYNFVFLETVLVRRRAALIQR